VDNVTKKFPVSRCLTKALCGFNQAENPGGIPYCGFIGFVAFAELRRSKD